MLIVVLNFLFFKEPRTDFWGIGNGSWTKKILPTPANAKDKTLQVNEVLNFISVKECGEKFVNP